MLVNVDRVLADSLGEPRRKGKELDYTCPFCARKGFSSPSHLHVNPVKGAARCHQCGFATRNLLRLIRLVIGKDSEFPLFYANEGEGSFLSTVRDIFITDTSAPGVSLPDGYKPLILPARTPTERRVFAYITHRRRIDKSVAEDLDVGFVDSGELALSVVFPIYAGDRLIYYTTRRITGFGRKSKNPESPRSGVLFNLELARAESHVIVCEGVFSALSFGRRGVALLGRDFSAEQCAALARLPLAKEITFCLDQDAEAKGLEFSRRLRSAAPDKCITWMRLPAESDPNELDPDQLRLALRGRREPNYVTAVGLLLEKAHARRF